MWKTIINLLFPINCLNCKKEGEFICSSCFEKIEINKKFYFDKTDILKKTIVVGNNDDDLLKQAIYRYKYDFIKDLSKPLGKLMVIKLKKVIPRKIRNDIIFVPIPLHPKRLRWRGFNQSELLAQEINQKLNIPVVNNLLIRTKYALPQVKVQKSFQRWKNINNVFGLNLEMNSGIVRNKIIIIVDDISTTGATLKEAARILNTLKPKQIWGLVLKKD